MVTAALCIFLVLLVGAAQLLHSHPVDSPPDANCSLCVVAHLSATPTPFIAGPALSAILRAIPPPDPIHSATGAAILAYSIRPPPALHPHA